MAIFRPLPTSAKNYSHRHSTTTSTQPLSTRIVETENDLKPKTLRNLTEVDIAILFMRYVQEIKEEIRERYNAKILRAEIINKSNSHPQT